MSDLMKAFKNRRSVRQYTGEAIEREKLEQILKVGLLSASGRNLRPWELIVVRDRKTLETMAQCRAMGAAMLASAACAIVVLGDREKSDTIVEDCSIVMANMHLMADSLGVGSCWIQGRLRQAADGRTTEAFLREALAFPERLQLEAILSLGMPAQRPEPHTEEDLDWSKVHQEQF